MALLTLLRFAFVDQFKVMSQVHQVVIFKVINRLLATITKQQRTRRRPFATEAGTIASLLCLPSPSGRGRPASMPAST